MSSDRSTDDTADELLRTALHEAGGESVEGAFVDHWETYAGRAIDSLIEIFGRDGFTPADEDRIRRALREPGVRTVAGADLLVQLDKHLRPLLREFLLDPSADVRAIAATAAVRLGEPELWVPMLKDGNASVRLAAVTALASDCRRPHNPLPHLREMLDDIDPAVRAVVGGKIGFSRDPAGQQLIIRRLEVESDTAVRRAIITSIANETNRAAITIRGDRLEAYIGASNCEVLHGLINDADPAVRQLCATALGKFGRVQEGSTMLARLAVETEVEVRRALTNRAPYHHLKAQSLPVLLNVLATDPDPVVRWQTATELRYCGPPALAGLLAALHDSSVGVRREAAESLGVIGDASVLPELNAALANPASKSEIGEIRSAIRMVEERLAQAAKLSEPNEAAPKLPTATHSPPLRQPTPELSKLIQRWIEELNPRGLGDWPKRVCKEDLHALPILGNGVDLWAIRPDGVVLCLDLDSVRHAAEPETDRERAIAALVEGAKRYPKLRALLPPPESATG